MSDPAISLRVLVVANKRWEVDPLVSVFLERKARPAALRDAVLESHPALRGGPSAPAPRLSATYETAVELLRPDEQGRRDPRRFEPALARATVQLWCIEDAMRAAVGDRRISSSSSREKAEHALPAIAAAARRLDPDLVIAFGTAGIEAPVACNGCVAVGSRVFVNDPFAGAPDAVRRPPGAPEELWLWDPPPGAVGMVLESPRLKPELFGPERDPMRRACEGLFLRPPMSPAAAPVVLMGQGFTSLGTVNVSNYDDYAWADADTLRRFRRASRQGEVGSVETTHGLIRLQFRDRPFLFVSGITDALGAFDHEVGTRPYAQNLVAAHNAGVVVAHLVPELLAAHAADRLLVGAGAAPA